MKLTVLRRGGERLLPQLRVRGPGCGALLAFQLAILLLSIRHVNRRDAQLQPVGGTAAAGGEAATAAGAAAAAWPVTSDLNEWVQLPYAYSFKAPQSQCSLHPDGA